MSTCVGRCGWPIPDRYLHMGQQERELRDRSKENRPSTGNVDSSTEPVLQINARKPYQRAVESCAGVAHVPALQPHQWQAQKGVWPPRAVMPEKSLADRIALSEQRREKARLRLERRLCLLRALRDGDGGENPDKSSSSGSDSTTSSSSSDSSSQE